MKTIFFAFFILLPVTLFADISNLKCSASGTKMLYINGVNVNQEDNSESTKNIQLRVVDPLTPFLDNNKVFLVEGIWNTSRLLSNDLEELKAQLAANHNGQKRIDYWKAMARNKFSLSESYLATIDAALTQIANKEKTYDKDGNFIANQNAYSESDLYKDIAVYNKQLANLLANAASDVAVVEALKVKVKEAYNNGSNKLIVIAHSQGNEVLYSAIKDLRSDPNFLKTDSDVLKFDGLVGYMQVAPPSPKLVTNMPEKINYYSVDDPASPYANHAQYIRHDHDGIIGTSFLMTGVLPIAANYKAKGLKDINWGTLGLANLFNAWGTRGIGAFYHGMDDVYLSETNLATRDSDATHTPKALVDHFKDNMREIASKLQDNCDFPDINITVDGAIKDSNDPAIFNYAGYTNFNNSIKITATDKNDIDSSTQFKFTYHVFNSSEFNRAGVHGAYFPLKIQDALNARTILDFAIPFSQTSYTLNVVAINKSGKSSTRDFLIKTHLDHQPTARVITKSCHTGVGVEPDGRIYVINSGGYDVTILVSDVDSGSVHISKTATGVASGLAFIYDMPFNTSYQSASEANLYFYSNDSDERFQLNIPACEIGVKFYQ